MAINDPFPKQDVHLRKEEPSCPEKLLMAFYFYIDCDTESLTLYQSDCDIIYVVRCMPIYSVYYTASISGDRLFCMLITLNSLAPNRPKNLYFHSNAYYHDTRINDYVQCSCLNNRG